MGDTLAKTLQARSKASMAIIDAIQQMFLIHLSKHESHFVLTLAAMAHLCTDPLPTSAVHAATELRWVLKNCTMPSADFISMHNSIESGSRRAKMIVCVLQSRSKDLQAELFLEELKISAGDPNFDKR
jgi:hypothetical protein